MDAADAITRDSDDEDLRVDTPKPQRRGWFGGLRSEMDKNEGKFFTRRAASPDEGPDDEVDEVPRQSTALAPVIQSYHGCGGCLMDPSEPLEPIEAVMDYYTDSCYFFECLAGLDDGIPVKQKQERGIFFWRKAQQTQRAELHL